MYDHRTLIWWKSKFGVVVHPQRTQLPSHSLHCRSDPLATRCVRYKSASQNTCPPKKTLLCTSIVQIHVCVYVYVQSKIELSECGFRVFVSLTQFQIENYTQRHLHLACVTHTHILYMTHINCPTAAPTPTPTPTLPTPNLALWLWNIEGANILHDAL